MTHVISLCHLYGPILSPCFRSAQYAHSTGCKHSWGSRCCLSGSTHKATPVPRSLLWFLSPKIIPPALGGGAGMTEPRLLRAPFTCEFPLLCAVSVHKSTFMGIQALQPRAKNWAGSFSLLYLLSFQKEFEFSLLQQNVQTLLLRLSHSLVPQHGVLTARRQILKIKR